MVCPLKMASLFSLNLNKDSFEFRVVSPCNSFDKSGELGSMVISPLFLYFVTIISFEFIFLFKAEPKIGNHLAIWYFGLWRKFVQLFLSFTPKTVLNPSSVLFFDTLPTT